MRSSRLLSMLILLQLRGRVTAEALAAEFEVSVRTIYRDMDALSAAGVPLYAERGRAGGFALLEGYRTRLTGLTPQEAHALALAGSGTAAADLGLGVEAAAAQLKMLASLPGDFSTHAEKIRRRFHMDPAPWLQPVASPEILPSLAAALWADRRIKIAYESWKAKVSRTIDPLGLVQKAGVWYLVAQVKAQTRTYRVAAISTFALARGKVRRPPRFDLARHWARFTKDFESRLLCETAHVRLSQKGLELLKDLHPIAAAAVENAAKPAPQRAWLEADIPVEKEEEAVRLVLRLGGELEVLSPKSLRRAVAVQAREIAARHHEG